VNEYSSCDLNKWKRFSKEMVHFTPSDEHVFVPMSDGQVERKIYSEPIPLKDSDLNHFKEFNAFITSQNKPLLDLNADPGRKWLRFLTASQFDYPVAFQKMNDWAEWCKTTFPLDFKCIAKM
jgi:hypothetical protein